MPKAQTKPQSRPQAPSRFQTTGPLPVACTALPSDSEMLEWLLDRMRYPGVCRCHKSCSSDSERAFICSYGVEGPVRGHSGDTYASTARQAIAKAMRLYEAQVKAAKLIAEAQG